MKIAIGRRTLLAATCRVCGVLQQGHQFKRHRRNRKDKWPYLDMRCTGCKWRANQQRRDLERAVA